MKVFVAGATGAIGRPLVRGLLARGHEVLGLARTDANDALLRSLGATPRRADLFDAESLARAAEGADAVVRVATRLPLRPRAPPEAWLANDVVRRDGTRALVDAAARVGARLYAQESVVWVARPEDGAPFDERSPPKPDATTRSALEAEVLAAAEGSRRGLAVATLRLGWVYGGEDPRTRLFARAMRRRALGLPEGGVARFSFLHAEDAARAFVAAVERGAGGLWHVVDDEPAPTRDFFLALAREADAPPPMRVPEWVSRWFAGEETTRFLSTPIVTSSARFRREAGWAPRFPSYREGLAQVGRAWKEETPRERVRSS